MKTIIKLLQENPRVSDYKINIHNKESCELFFVKGALETVRRTDTCDKEVTVYVDHDGCKGDAQFFLYPSTTPEQMAALVDEAVEKALLIQNAHYTLPQGQTGEFTVESNFDATPMPQLAQNIAASVLAANRLENAALNSVEVFVNKHTDRILSSRGMDKTQVRYDAMVEAIPTYNGAQQSVELYEQYNFNCFDPKTLEARIGEKLNEVKARYEAKAPEAPISCQVVLRDLEISELMSSIASNLNYAQVYAHYNLFSKGDAIQKAPTGDRIGITMAGQVSGSDRSACFDADGLALSSRRIVEDGKAVDYYGSNRFAQYLNMEPTGQLPCLVADAGSLSSDEIFRNTVLEVVSMSGLQVDFYSDYIGGEVRLAYYHAGGKVVPVTGISISGKLSQVLESIRFSMETTVAGGYNGPKMALVQDMKIF